MNAPKKAPPIKAENLLPARLADQQLDHLERMIGAVVRNGLTAGSTTGSTAGLTTSLTSSPTAPMFDMDPDYWESRVRALVEENNLLVVQQQRVQRLLIKLQQRAKNKSADQTPA